MRVLTVCVFVTAIQASVGQNIPSPSMKYSPVGADPIRERSFFELPRSLYESTENDGWKLFDYKFIDGVRTFCRRTDPRVCLLMDSMASIAGIQLSVPVADLKKTDAPVHPPMVNSTMMGVGVYSTRIFFVDPATLPAGRRVLNSTTPAAPDGIYVPTRTGEYRKIPNNENDITKDSLWVKGGCIPNAGRHYFYNVSKQMKCEDMDIFFALYDEQSHKLVGTGFVIHGPVSTEMAGRTWYENPPSSIIKVIAPDAPDCAVELANEHGLIIAHIYTSTNEPWKLTC